MDHDTPLVRALAANRDPAWEPLYDALVARLVRAGAMDGAPVVGQVLDDLALPDLSGALIRLSDLVAPGPVVLSFNRGHWCGFCCQEIAAWHGAGQALAAAGGRFVMILPEGPAEAAELAQLGPRDATVLLDADMGTALRLGLTVPIGNALDRAYLDADLDIAALYGGTGHLLPVPATLVVDSDMTVRLAHVDVDFRRRAEPAQIIACIASLTA